MTDSRRALFREVFRIRTRLLLASAFLVIVPLFGLSFARTYERELLRSEEEGLSAVAAALGAGLAAADGSPQDPALQAAARQAAARLRAQVRVLDPGGRALLDTGPERIWKLTRGRTLLSREGRDHREVPEIAVGDPAPESGTFGERPEVARALSGQAGRATRVSQRLRAVRLFVAEPIRKEGGPVLGAVYVSRTTYPVLLSLYRVRNGLLRVALVSLGIAFVLALFLSLTISRPLRRLTEATRRLAAGERHVPLRLRGRDEIAELARTFDAMARELDARLSYISELAANVSHEFKTPIASIRGAAELLREGAADDPAARARFLENILADSERLSLLTTRLLQLSRIEAHREPAVPLDYRELVEEAAGRCRAGGHPVTLAYEAQKAHLLGAPEQLDSVLSNLLDNAVRFSPPGTPVSLRVTEAPDGRLRTEVSDRGPGISPGNLGKIWDRFFTTARDRGGTGLGLAIARAAVEAHGGEIGVESAPGQGCTFWFVLPRRL